MFVTSDRYHLRLVGFHRGFEWRENLVGGVAVHGSRWRGIEPAARFLLECSAQLGLASEMVGAGYAGFGRVRTRQIQPRSLERLANGDLPGAQGAAYVFVTGFREAEGAEGGAITHGGTVDAFEPTRRSGDASLIPAYSYIPFNAGFAFPLKSAPIVAVTDLFRLAIELLGAEYGYYYVRDDLAFPSGYASALEGVLDNDYNDESADLARWFKYARDGNLWVDPFPKLRDLYEVNLLSGRHLTHPVENFGCLAEWISARTGRGRLEALADDRWLWKLTSHEMQAIRPELHAAGLTVGSCHRVYRDLPESGENRPKPPVPWIAHLTAPRSFRGSS